MGALLTLLHVHTRAGTAEEPRPMQVAVVAPYERWYERFEAALKALESRQQQQQSPLPTIYQWRQPQPAHSTSRYSTCALSPVPKNTHNPHEAWPHA